MPPPSKKTPDIIDGRYQVERELGRGGMGVVYLAHDVGLGRPVALKLISPTLTGDSSVMMRFRREARSLASIQSRHVVQVYAFGQQSGSYFFAMEFVRGKALSSMLEEYRERSERMPTDRVVTLLLQLAQGLAAIHQKGIVHRDVKPGNILIEDDTGRPVLVDFGLAEPKEVPGLPAGSPNYAPYEQMMGEMTTPQSDIYAFGVVAFELLTGRTPFVADKYVDLIHQHGFLSPPLVSSIIPELAQFDMVIDKALRKKKEDRYKSMVDMETALRDAAENWSPPARHSRAPADIDRSKVRVLIVDDDPKFRELASRAVELAMSDVNLAVSGVGGGDEATDAAYDLQPDLILLDYDMPKFNGVQVLTSLRGAPNGDAMRVIVLSSDHGLKQSRFRFQCLGVRDFVVKPVALTKLIDTVLAVADRAGWGAERPTMRPEPYM